MRDIFWSVEATSALSSVDAFVGPLGGDSAFLNHSCGHLSGRLFTMAAGSICGAISFVKPGKQPVAAIEFRTPCGR
jgi:hypothetical protein